MILFLFFIFLFGLIIGSFLNCLIWRLHNNESMMGRSYCPKCRHQIDWYDNIPVLSYVLLMGKCRHCQQRISVQYPLVEFITGVLFVVAFLSNFQFSPQLDFGTKAIFNFQTIFNELIFNNSNKVFNLKFLIQLFRDWFIIAVMIIVFIYDLRWYMILDIVTLPACAVVFFINLFLGYSWQNMLISGIIGGGFFFLQFVISKGKWIGGGDIRLGILMGFALGWPIILVAILLAYFVGSMIGLALIAGGKKEWGSQVPLGIFLSAATLVALFWGQSLLNWYLNFLIL